MDFTVKHQLKSRIRVHLHKSRMTYEEADMLQHFLLNQPEITAVRIYERTADLAVSFDGSVEQVLKTIKEFRYGDETMPKAVNVYSGRPLNAEYRERLIGRIFFYMARRLFVPAPLRTVYTIYSSMKYLLRGVQCIMKKKLEVPVLDAAAITASIIRGNIDTASSIMFLLGIGELLEDWTHKKSVGDLAQSMSLNVKKVWVEKNGTEILAPADDINPGDKVIIHMGNVIPFDGDVISGEAMVNQASMTGEPLAVRKAEGSYVYAGTAVKEGEICIKVRETKGDTRFEKIVAMIDETEKLKSSSESKAEHLADRLVPYTLAGAAAMWLLTGNAAKAIAVLMVDFSCALKLAMPVAVLSAIREAASYDIMVKGGKYLEAVAEASVVVFDKTGTLTSARPVVMNVISFDGSEPDELLRMAACLEEHFPHSMAKAVVDAAKKKGLEHQEMHSKVRYIVAHGISSEIEGKTVLIGSHHFIFEDEKCTVPFEYASEFDKLPEDCTLLYMAIEGRLAAVICIEDALREEAGHIIGELKKAGISRAVMMTGDSERIAASVAAQAGMDEYFSEVLPEDKAVFIRKEKEKGNVVIMIGDGINDSPALSAADAGIAISDGAEIAREIADIIIEADGLCELAVLKRLGNALRSRIRKKYRAIIGINAALIVLGAGGIIMPAISAFLHNISTIAITVNGMKPLIEKGK